MQFSRAVRQLGRNDVKLIGRDTFLIGMFSYAIMMALVLRFGLPWAVDFFAENQLLEQPLQDWYPMFIAFGAIFAGGMLAGMMFGFMLLDEKEDNTLQAMLVTPLPVQHYIAYRIAIPAALAFFVILLDFLIINVALPPVLPMVLIAVGGALTAPITTLFFIVFARNKVQGFALTKFTGIAGLLIIAAWFVPEPVEFLFGLFPPYWVSKAYWLVLEGNPLWVLALVAGVVLQLALIFWLARRFNQVIYRSV